MESKMDQMNALHAMCCKEINLLNINLDILINESERCKRKINELMSADGANNMCGLVIFDRYMTKMFAALNMARKYNIHLEVNNTSETVINTSTITCLNGTNYTQNHIFKDLEFRNSCLENDGYNYESNICYHRIKKDEHIRNTNKDEELCCQQRSIKPIESIKNFQEKSKLSNDEKNIVDNINYNVDKLLKIIFPSKCLGEFYKGFEFQACVIYVQDHKTLEFFICLNDDYKTLYDLSSNQNYKPLCFELLPPDDVFLILEKDGNGRECFLRAIIVPQERHESRKLLYLVDLGEVLPLTDKCKTYLAPFYYKQIPPLAIKCILEGIEDCSSKLIKDHYKCEQLMRKNEYETTHFRVVYQKDRVLHVLMLEKPKLILSSVQETNPFLNSFFSENNCNSSKSSDVLATSALFNESWIKEPTLHVNLEIGDQVQVMVTHIVNPISFYGIIQTDYCFANKTFSWDDRQIPQLQKQVSTPELNEIVLSQYAKDGYWYRAKIIDIDSEKNLYKVFYVDFGNTEIVALSGLANCSKEQLKDPLRAVLFHLSDLSIDVHSLKEIDLKNVIENVVVTILDQILNVEIVERHNDDLVVRLIDPQYAEIPKMLIDTGVVKEI